MPKFAVIDTETTGFSNQDRVVEIAIVGLLPDGSIEHAYSTLLNPHRDLGAQHIHKISEADVLLAPDFRDIAGDLIALLRGCLVVGHNVSFDVRMITNEYARAGVPISIATADCFCTKQMTAKIIPGEPNTLEACCCRAGVSLEHAHSALGDALATACLLRVLAARKNGFIGLCEQFNLDARAARVQWPLVVPKHTRTVQRGVSGSQQSQR